MSAVNGFETVRIVHHRLVVVVDFSVRCFGVIPDYIFAIGAVAT
jgi:hypothetical protein